MANTNGWGDGAANNTIGWGQGANNAIGWGDIHADSWAGATDIVGSSTDPDAEAFFTATGITDATQQAAINTLVADLKGYSLWDKMKVLYPYVGGTASTHKFNLKDPRDLDAAYRLVFNGGWTHSSTGALPNGTNGYADTKFTANTFTSTSNLSAGVYLRTNNSTTGYDFGQGFANFTREGVCLVARSSSNQVLFSAIGSSSTAIANTNSSGLFVITRANTTEQNLHRRVSQTANTTQTIGINNSFGNGNIFVGAINDLVVGALFYSNRQNAFLFLGDYLTQAEVDDMTTAIQAFQTTLGRNV
jgi:hypothetical protein